MPDKPNLNRGSVPLAANQFAYHVLLWRVGTRTNTLRTTIRFPLWTGSVPLIDAVKPEAPPAAVGCGPLLVVISTLAGDPALLKDAGAVGTDEQTNLPIAGAAYDLGHGDNLFLISDMLLTIRKMFAEEGVISKLLNVAVMNTYTAAQLFLVEGLLAFDHA